MGARVRVGLLVGCIALLALAPGRASALALESIGPSFDQPLFVTSPAGDPRLFVVERPGYIQVIDDGTVSQFLDIHTMVDSIVSERGLLSMAFDPNYASNGLFYVFYNDNGTAGGSDGDIRIEEFHVSSNPNAAAPASRRTVWTFSHSAGNHNGGQLQFGPDGYLYISVGDNANGANAQELDRPYGKVFRIDPHGAGNGMHGIPSTNPFVGTPGAVQEGWTLGLRNPFRFSFDHLTGDLIIGDVGDGSHEEIDFSPASTGGGRGANYGWPCREGFSPHSGTCVGSVVDPVFDYPHADPTPSDPGNDAYGCAIVGGYVYRGSQAPEIAGRYLYADLCTAQLRSIQLGVSSASGDRAETAAQALTSARSFGQDSSCNLYVMNTSTVFRIAGSAQSAAPACASGPPSPVAAPPSAPVATAIAEKKKCKKRRHRHQAAATKTAPGSSRAAESQKRKKCKRKRHAGMTGTLTIGG